MPEIHPEAEKLRRQVSTLAAFGTRALRTNDIGELLQEATRLVSDAIDVDLVKVLEILPDSNDLLVRAGVNWNPGVVGHATIAGGAGSPAGQALRTNSPMVTEDVATESRYRIPGLLIEHGVRSTVNVVIRGDAPFGVLEVDSRQLRRFSQDDIDFLQNYANLLASAIDRARIQNEQQVLRRELQHRISNMLATIGAVARRTRARSRSLDEFAKAFDQRLASIARTHRLLNRGSDAIQIRELLAQELSAQGAIEGENLVQRGPDVWVPARHAQVLSMAIHELTTNAVKHGALSLTHGRIEVAWSATESGTGRHLRIRWREWGVPLAHPPARRGYGSEILEKSLPRIMNGSFERVFHPDGIECTISLPLNSEGGNERAD